MAFDVYPVGANSGFSEESSIDSEKDRDVSSLGGRLTNFVVAPFSNGDFGITTSGSSLDVDVAPGAAFMGGHRVVSDATETITVDPSTTNHIWLVVRDSETGNAIIVYNTDGSTPAGAYATKLWEVTTDSSGVTGTTDTRRYVPYPNLDPAESITGLKATPQGTPATPSIALDSTGVKAVSVTFDHAYRDQVFAVVATLNNLDDTAASFGWIRTKNVTVDGFDIEAKVDKQGSSGSTADFSWTAQGR